LGGVGFCGAPPPPPPPPPPHHPPPKTGFLVPFSSFRQVASAACGLGVGKFGSALLPQAFLGFKFGGWGGGGGGGGGGCFPSITFKNSH